MKRKRKVEKERKVKKKMEKQSETKQKEELERVKKMEREEARKEEVGSGEGVGEGKNKARPRTTRVRPARVGRRIARAMTPACLKRQTPERNRSPETEAEHKVYNKYISYKGFSCLVI